MRPSDFFVVIPAHNEEELIGACLHAVARAAQAVSVRVEVAVILDECSDATAQVVNHAQQGLRSLLRVQLAQTALANVGAARGVGFGLARGGSRTWFATTDADSLVPSNWFAAQLEAAVHHDVFVGTIEVIDWSHRPPEVRQRHESTYLAGPGHRHIHGASLGISAAAYHLVGGFAPRRVGEDVALVESCAAAGLSIAWSHAAPVITSARRSLRTGGGFGARLSELELSMEAK